MPLYTVTTQIGLLSAEAKAKLAAEVTTLHSEYSGVPKNWVHIVFQDYPSGSGFTAGLSSATAALILLIRSGRSAEYKSGLVMRLWELLQSATGAADDQIVIGIHGVPPSQAMEMGKIMPNSRLALGCSAIDAARVLACDNESCESDRDEVFHDRGRIAADAGDRCETRRLTSVRADYCPRDAGNRAEHSRAVVHRCDHPSHERSAHNSSREPPGLCARRSIRQHIPDVLSDGSDRHDDTPDVAAHEHHCSHRRKGAKPRDKAEAQGK